MHRFFVSQLDLVDEGQALICSEDLIHQFTKVLRFVAGEKVVLLNGGGYEFVVELREFSSKKIIGKTLEKKFCDTELPVRIVIAQAVLKNLERMEWLLQKGTELGVSGFMPLITDRTERKVLGKEERLMRILKEAAEQSGRGKVPEFLAAEKFEKIFPDYGKGGEKLIVVPHPCLSGRQAGADVKFSEFCREKLVMEGGEKFSGELVVCVGPEGGFTDREIELAKGKGAHVVTLGSRILRAETVGVVMAALIGSMFDW